jgi:hypothetical protein
MGLDIRVEYEGPGVVAPTHCFWVNLALMRRKASQALALIGK